MATSCLIPAAFDSSLVEQAAKGCLENLGGNPDLVLAFVSSDYREKLPELIEALQIDGHSTRIVGASGSGLYGFRNEHENKSGVSLLFLKLPGIEISRTDQTSHLAKLRKENPNPAGMLLFGNPVLVESADLLPSLSDTFPEVPVLGGMASGGPEEEDVFVFTENGIVSSGTILITLSGSLRVVPLVSQGCRPIGEPFVITGSESENVLTIGRKRAFSVLEKTWQALPDELQAEAEGSIHAGIVIDEQVEKFEIGNFLVRHIVSTDLEKGWLELDDAPRLGQTLQFQMRDGKAAEEDLKSHCRKSRETDGSPFAALVFGAQSRGKALFDAEDRDVRIIEENLGTFPLSGFFTNGEFGPVGGIGSSHTHSLCGALFYPK